MTDFFKIKKMTSDPEIRLRRNELSMKGTPEVVIENVVREPKKYLIKRKYDLEDKNPKNDFSELYNIDIGDRAKTNANALKKKILFESNMLN